MGWFSLRRRAVDPVAERARVEDVLVGVEQATPDQAQAVWLDLASRGSDAAAGLRAYVLRRPRDQKPLLLWLSVDSGDACADAIATLLAHPDPSVVATVLSALPEPAPAPHRLRSAMLPLLAHRDPEIRALACARLPMVAHDATVAEAVAALLSDPAHAVQLAAVNALGHLGAAAAGAIPALQRLAASRDAVELRFTPGGARVCLGTTAADAAARIRRRVQSAGQSEITSP